MRERELGFGKVSIVRYKRPVLAAQLALSHHSNGGWVMATMIIHHHVRDYEAWRPIYDAHEPARYSAGLSNGRVFRAADDPQDIVILFDMADRQRAEAFAASEDLKTAMQQAGVEGRPEMQFIG
jgi:hypothetical protein